MSCDIAAQEAFLPQRSFLLGETKVTPAEKLILKLRWELDDSVILI